MTLVLLIIKSKHTANAVGYKLQIYYHIFEGFINKEITKIIEENILIKEGAELA